MTSAQVVSIIWAVLQTAIIILIPTLGVLVGRWIKAKEDEVKSHTATDKTTAVFLHLQDAALVYVRAANQWLSTADGQKKKAWVIAGIQAWFASQHMELDATAIEAALEAAVADTKASTKYVGAVGVTGSGVALTPALIPKISSPAPTTTGLS